MPTFGILPQFTHSYRGMSRNVGRIAILCPLSKSVHVDAKKCRPVFHPKHLEVRYIRLTVTLVIGLHGKIFPRKNYVRNDEQIFCLIMSHGHLIIAFKLNNIRLRYNHGCQKVYLVD